MDLVEDACLLIDIERGGVGEIALSIARALAEIGVEARPVACDPHVSIGYTLGQFTLEHLRDVAREIAEKPFALRVAGVEVLCGIASSCDYVALKIAENQEIDYAVGLISENGPTRSFAGGFRAHLSILTIEKGALPDMDDVARFLELKALGLLPDIMLNITGISIFSGARDMVAQVSFSSSI
jgi:hypothetical protein